MKVEKILCSREDLSLAEFKEAVGQLSALAREYKDPTFTNNTSQWDWLYSDVSEWNHELFLVEKGLAKGNSKRESGEATAPNTITPTESSKTAKDADQNK